MTQYSASMLKVDTDDFYDHTECNKYEAAKGLWGKEDQDPPQDD